MGVEISIVLWLVIGIILLLDPPIQDRIRTWINEKWKWFALRIGLYKFAYWIYNNPLTSVRILIFLLILVVVAPAVNENGNHTATPPPQVNANIQAMIDASKQMIAAPIVQGNQSIVVPKTTTVTTKINVCRSQRKFNTANHDRFANEFADRLLTSDCD